MNIYQPLNILTISAYEKIKNYLSRRIKFLKIEAFKRILEIDLSS